MANTASESKGISQNGRLHRPTHIILPFYRNPQLVRSVFESLLRCGEELSELQCSLVAIDDTSTDELDQVLKHSADALSRFIPTRVIKNERNIGFVKSANVGMRQSLENRSDALLLNSDTQVFPGAISAMRKVAYSDPMIGFVSPRSNNATICSLPVQPEHNHLPPEQSFQIFSQLSHFLPEYHYVPTAVGFCMLIKWSVLSDFGLLDEAYGKGYNEENDLVMRANRCGFRAAVANRAFVYHIGEASFSQADEHKTLLDQVNATTLNGRYPEYPWAVRKYLTSPQYEYEQMLAALISDSDGCVDVLLDMSNITASHNGTFQSAKQILIHAASAWKHWCKLHVRISPEALAFHQLDSLENVYFVPLDTNKRFAAAFHIGQPFKLTTIERMNCLGVLNYWVMLDTIAWDCQYLHQIDERLDSMWRYVCESSTGIFYISKFVRDQFQRRFRFGQHVQQKVVYLSLNPAEHCESATLNATESRHILVIGNHYEHKFLRPTVEALVASFPFEKIVVVGLPSHSAQRVIAYASGQLSDTQIDNLYASCKFLVYPSQYEGFGLPVMKALAYNKPIVARSLPTTKELAEALDAGTNIRFYETTQDLIHILRNEDLHWSNMPGKMAGGWEAYVGEVGSVIRHGLESADSLQSVIPRMQHAQMLTGSVVETTALPLSPDSQGEVQSLRAKNHELQVALAARNARIADLQTSISWRMTAPARAVGSQLLKLLK